VIKETAKASLISGTVMAIADANKASPAGVSPDHYRGRRRFTLSDGCDS
jgi:hypothetical protein